MPGSTNQSSFIPKQGAVKHKRSVASRKIYIFSLVSYIVMFSALLGAGGVFIYKAYLDRQFDQAVRDLANSITTFNRDDMEELKFFNDRLKQAEGRVENHPSARAFLETLEDVVVSTVWIDSLKVTRVGDTKFTAEAEMSSDSFDSALIQRGVLLLDAVIANAIVTDLGTEVESSDGDPDEPRMASSEDIIGVNFKAEFEVPLEKVPFDPALTSGLSSSSSYDDELLFSPEAQPLEETVGNNDTL